MIKEIRKALTSRELSVSELINHCMEKTKKAEECNAFISLCFQEAFENAEESQKLINSGKAPSLCGIPVAIKDNFAYQDHRLSCGSDILKDYISPYSATSVEKLQLAGALIIGKTNMDEFGMGSHSKYSCYGGVKNPINQEISPGGSSGGSAVAVKVGAAVAALGSDTGGSVRLPAAYCGVCGLRPTYGAVSRYGLVSFSSSLDTIGTLGNTPEDCYEIFSAISEADNRDSTSLSGEQLSVDFGNLKVCSFCEDLADETDKEVYSVIKEFLRSNIKSFGELTEVKLPQSSFLVSAYYLISSAEAASNLARFDGIKYGGNTETSQGFQELLSSNRTNLFGDEVKKRILLGNYCLSKGAYDQYYLKALSFREDLRRNIDEILTRFDTIVLPTSLITVPRLSETESISKKYGNDKCNSIASLCGLPAISFPVGVDSKGMPVSLSIIGRKFGEKYICELADRLISEVGIDV